MKVHFKLILPILCLNILISCTNSASKKSEEKVDTTSKSAVLSVKAFQKSMDGKNTDLYVLKNKNGAEAAFTKGQFVDTAYSSPSYLKEFFFKK